MESMQQLTECVAYLKTLVKEFPTIGVILGSGLGALADEMKNKVVIAYKDIPHFPTSTVHGHMGQLVVGELEGKQVIAMQGRFHYYEGYSLDEVTLPVRAMAALGVQTLFVTNAAGGVNKDLAPGDLMLIEDHLNFVFNNPLIGPNDEQVGQRFPDMSEAYSKELQEMAQRVAHSQGIDIKRGVYAWMSGPSYETPAEIRMLRTLGADAVGMSTVPEVIVARHSGLKVLGISCISNMAAGILPQPLAHEEVMETANLVKEKFIRFVRGIIASV